MSWVPLHQLLLMLLVPMVVSATTPDLGGQSRSSKSDSFLLQIAGQDCELLPNDLVETPEGDILVAGSYQIDPDVADLLLLRMDPGGVIRWACRVGGADRETGKSVLLTGDGGFVVVGTMSGRVTGREDLIRLRFGPSGGLMDSAAIGSLRDDVLQAAVGTTDGGILLLGTTDGAGAGGVDVLLVRLDPDGGVVWSRTLGTPWDDKAWNLLAVEDGGFLLAGSVWDPSTQDSTPLLVRLDQDGGVAWQRIYIGANLSESRSLTGSWDGGFLLTGIGTRSSLHTLIKLDPSGEVLWARRNAHPLTSDSHPGPLVAQGTDGTIWTTGTTQHGSCDWSPYLCRRDRTGGGALFHYLDFRYGELRSLTASTTGGMIAAGSISRDIILYRSEGDGYIRNCRWISNAGLIDHESLIEEREAELLVTELTLTGWEPQFTQELLMVQAELLCPEEPGINFQVRMSDDWLVPGDELRLSYQIWHNVNPFLRAPLYCLLEVQGEYWCWPNWSYFRPPDEGSLDCSWMDLGSYDTGMIFTVDPWPDLGQTTMEDLRFWVALLNEEQTEVLDELHQVTWGFGPE